MKNTKQKYLFMLMLDLFYRYCPTNLTCQDGPWSTRHSVRILNSLGLLVICRKRSPTFYLIQLIFNKCSLLLVFFIHVRSPSCSPFQIRKSTGDLWKVFQTGNWQGHFLEVNVVFFMPFLLKFQQFISVGTFELRTVKKVQICISLWTLLYIILNSPGAIVVWLSND